MTPASLFKWLRGRLALSNTEQLLGRKMLVIKCKVCSELAGISERDVKEWEIMHRLTPTDMLTINGPCGHPIFKHTITADDQDICNPLRQDSGDAEARPDDEV